MIIFKIRIMLFCAIILVSLAPSSFATQLNQSLDIRQQEAFLLSSIKETLDEYSMQEMVEILTYRQQDLNLNGTQEFIVLWQLTTATRWDVMLTILNGQGLELDMLPLGRNVTFFDIKQLNNTPVIIIENLIPQAGDIICCPSQKQILKLKFRNNNLHAI